jgi:hypothetical protein
MVCVWDWDWDWRSLSVNSGVSTFFLRAVWAHLAKIDSTTTEGTEYTEKDWAIAGPAAFRSSILPSVFSVVEN